MTPQTCPKPGPKLVPDSGAQLEAHWGRFVAWCEATGHESLPATAATIGQFLTLFPGAASTQRLRRRAIRTHHLEAVYPDPIPMVEARLATDLRAEFPEMKGFSPRNLAYMRAFAAAWPDEQILQQAVAELPWGAHHGPPRPAP